MFLTTITTLFLQILRVWLVCTSCLLVISPTLPLPCRIKSWSCSFGNGRPSVWRSCCGWPMMIRPPSAWPTLLHSLCIHTLVPSIDPSFQQPRPAAAFVCFLAGLCAEPAEERAVHWRRIVVAFTRRRIAVANHWSSRRCQQSPRRKNDTCS